MKIWIAADSNFSEDNEELITSWNKNVSDGDEVLILGNFIKDNNFQLSWVKELLNKLKGNKVIIDYDEKKHQLSRDSLKELGFLRVHNIYCFVQKDNLIIHIIPSIERLSNFKEGKIIGASARSITKQKSILENNILSLSYEDWGFAPIEYDSIPDLYNNIKLFEDIKEEF